MTDHADNFGVHQLLAPGAWFGLPSASSSVSSSNLAFLPSTMMPLALASSTASLAPFFRCPVEVGDLADVRPT